MTEQFNFWNFLYLVFGIIATTSIALFAWLIKDYINFKFESARDWLKKSDWEGLCKQYRNTCEADFCRRVDNLTKVLDDCSDDLSSLGKDLIQIKTKIEPYAEKVRDIEDIKIRLVHLEKEESKRHV